ncbi:RNA 3'-terminal phosphate cyclase [Serendipita vermifera]|nr:RNA 3'-terminal phosphate cyclase [Serendipita vermifera]
MKIIEGSTLEGGGQILRNAVALSTLLGEGITVNNIRKGRTPPGMKAQHAAGINLVGQISQDSYLNGAFKDSQTLEYIPGKLTGGDYLADPGTAGSTTLLLQIALPCLLYASTPSEEGSKLCLRGGTNAIQAPQIDYTQQIFLPFMRQHFGVNVDLEIVRRGYYPKGGGEIVARIHPVSEPLPAITVLERGELTKIRGRSYVAGLSIKLAKECRDAAVALLTKKGVDPFIIDIPYVKELPTEAYGFGSGIVLWAETENGCIIGSSAIGKKGMDPVEVGKEAAEELFQNLKQGGCVDEYLQDQWIIFGALAKGTSRVRCGLPLTLHTRTAMWLAEQLTEAKFREIPDEDGKTVVLECDGIGFKPEGGQ